MVPFMDLKAQYYSLQEEIDAAVASVFENSQFILGQQVEAFEKEFATYCRAAHGIGVNSGTSALHLALLAAGVGPGDEVITVPFTFVATAAAIAYTGASPVFVDIDPRTYTIDVSQIEEAISERTKAIIPVHLYGHPADMDPILEIARRRGLVVIEDAAQAHGAEYKGRRVGSLGDLGCFSFYPSKNLGAFGEGGMVVTNDAGYARTMRMLRDWGQERKYHHVQLGYNYRLEGIQGAILGVKLRHLSQWIELRRRHAQEYTRLLKGFGLETPTEENWARHVYHIYAVKAPQRQALQAHLNAREIHTSIHYPIPLHLQQCFRKLAYRVGDFPVAERCANSVLSFPLYPEMNQGQIEEVCQAVAAYGSALRSAA